MIQPGVRGKMVPNGVIAALLVATSTTLPARAGAPLVIDHLIIYSRTGAPERAALKGAGFTIDPEVSHHPGQGTSSVSVEFLNGYLELLYPDPVVSVSPRMQVVAQMFRDKSNWRVTGVSPLGLQFRRTPATPASFPFATVKVHSDWMAAGEYLELLTPRAMTKALGLFVTPEPVDEAANETLATNAVKGVAFHHANGTQRITGVQVIAPSADLLPPAATYVSNAGSANFAVGSKWLLVLTLDSGRQKKARDLEPDLPLVVRY